MMSDEQTSGGRRRRRRRGRGGRPRTPAPSAGTVPTPPRPDRHQRLAVFQAAVAAHTQALDDAELQTLYGDAVVMFDAERELDSAVADLVQAPFDARVQQTLANYLGSEQLQRAT